MGITKKLVLALFVPLALCAEAGAQPVMLYTCQPFIKNGRGYYFVEPIAHVGQYGVHFAWACKDHDSDRVTPFFYSCSYDACNAEQLSRSLWRVATGQATLAKEWAQYSTLQFPATKDDAHYPLAAEAQEVLNQLKDRINIAKEQE